MRCKFLRETSHFPNFLSTEIFVLQDLETIAQFTVE